MISLQKKRPTGSQLCDICGEKDSKKTPCGCLVDIERRMRVDGVNYEMACLNRAYMETLNW